MFWDIFVSLCAKSGASPNGVAKEIGASSGSVTTWKQGRTPHNSTLIKIANYFGVSVDYLLGKEEKEKPAEIGELSEGEAIWLDAYRRLPQDARNAILGVLNEFGDIAPSLQGPVLELIRVALKGADNSACGLGSGYDVCARQDKAE